MPRKIDYPINCSFQEALEIASLVNKAGGRAPPGFVADGLGVKENTGAFRSKIAGAARYGMVERKNNELKLTDIGDKYFHPMNEGDKKESLIQAFSSVPIFKKILQQCAGQEIDKKTLESILIRIHDVNRKEAGRVAWYFFKANEQVALLEKGKDNKFLIPQDISAKKDLEGPEDEPEDAPVSKSKHHSKLHLDSGIFELLINLGNLLNNENEDSRKKSLDELKELLLKKKEEFTHSELFIDLLEADNPKIVRKLKDAIKKDLGIENEEQPAEEKLE